MSNIVGVGGSIHDFATCLLIDKKIIAIEDERITRVRYAVGSSEPCQPSLKYCLNEAGITLNDLDKFIANDDLLDVIDHPKIEFVNHHLTHAYSTFFTSPFEEAAILVVDGAGSKKLLLNKNEIRETTTYAYGFKNDLKVLSQVYGDLEGKNPYTQSQTVMSNSVGEFYRIIAEALELGWLVGPGKVMGLAPYGAVNSDDRFVDEMMKSIELLPEGQYKVNANGKKGLIDTLYQLRQYYHSKENPFVVDAAIAYSGQIILEKILIHSLDYLGSKVQTENLCLAGGVGLNSMANGKIQALTKFKNVHVFFAPGDSGTAIGAAIYGYLNNCSNCYEELIRFQTTPFLGKSYSANEIEKSLKTQGLAYTQPRQLHQEVAVLIAAGKTIAWFQGGSEFGPRALGNRSILADPRSPTMRDHINHRVKSREWFRPLAPAICAPATEKYFNALGPSSWMQFVWPVHDQYKEILPSITHVDGSARVQSVNKGDNTSFYKLLESFEEITGVPILLNTSLNIKGEPIVETPLEAIKAFTESAIDVLVLGDFLVIK